MLILKALDWSYDADLASPPARWDCTFLESGSTAYLPGEAIPKSPYERAAIDVTVDGHTQRLVVGVVREFGLTETPEGLRTRADGIDLKAVLLDFKPTGPKIYKGMTIASDSTISVGAINRHVLGTNSAGATIFADFFHSFQSVVSDVVRIAGGTPMFEGYDYYLAQEIQWETDQSANDVLQQVLGPFNVTERFKVDVFFEPNNVVWFKERGRYTPALADIEYKRLRQRDVRRSKYPPFNDVQVLGASFTHVEPDLPLGDTPIPGLPFTSPYTESYKVEERESSTGISTSSLSGSLDTLIATTWGIRYYNAKGEVLRHASTKRYSFHLVRDPATTAYKGTFSTSRTEYVEEQFEYGGPHGETTKRIRTMYVDDDTLYFKWNPDGTPPAVTSDSTVVEGAGRANFHQLVERDENLWEYDADGETTHSVEKTYRAKQPDPSDGTPQSAGLIVERDVEQFFFWSGGQRGRTTTTRNYDRDGAVAVPIAISTHTEFAYGKGRPSKGTSITTPDNRVSQRGNDRTSTKQLKAGPDKAQLKYSFPVLGRTEDCEYVRQKIITERRSTRYETTLSLYPNLGVVEGKDLTVVGPPARWERSTFYLVSRSARHDPDLLDMTVRGLAWIDP